MSEYIEVTIAVPIKLFIKKGSTGSSYGKVYGWISTFGVGSISKIETFSAISAVDAAWKMADRLAGVLSG